MTSGVKLAHWGKMLCVHAHLKMLILQTNLEARHLRQRPQSWHVDTCLHVERKRKQKQTCSWTFPETHMPRDEAWSRYLVSGFQPPTQLTFKCTLVIPCFHVAGFLNHLCWQAPANTQTAELHILGLVQANILYKHHDRSWYFNGYVNYIILVYHVMYLWYILRLWVCNRCNLYFLLRQQRYSAVIQSSWPWPRDIIFLAIWQTIWHEEQLRFLHNFLRLAGHDNFPMDGLGHEGLCGSSEKNRQITIEEFTNQKQVNSCKFYRILRWFPLPRLWGCLSVCHLSVADDARQFRKEKATRQRQLENTRRCCD